MVHFGEFLKTWSLRSNSVTRQVSFNRTKIGGKCQNSSATFWVIFKQCVLLKLFFVGSTGKLESFHFDFLFSLFCWVESRIVGKMLCIKSTDWPGDFIFWQRLSIRKVILLIKNFHGLTYSNIKKENRRGEKETFLDKLWLCDSFKKCTSEK